MHNKASPQPTCVRMAAMQLSRTARDHEADFLDRGEGQRCEGQARGREPANDTVMKATIHIECTPAEARACFGWPDVQPMQAAMMDRLQKRMVSEMDRFSPEALVNQWLTTLPQQIERMQDLFAQMMLGELGKGAVDLHGSGHLKHGEPAVLLLGFWATVMRFGSGWEGSGGRLSPMGLGAAWRRPGCAAARSRRRTPDSWSGPAGSGRSARAAQASCEPCAMRPRPDRTRCGSQRPAD